MSTKELRVEIGHRLQDAIRAAGLSQNEVGRRLGTTGSSVSSWCTGRSQPSLEQLAALMELVGESADKVLRGIGSKSKSANEVAARTRSRRTIFRRVRHLLDLLERQ